MFLVLCFSFCTLFSENAWTGPGSMNTSSGSLTERGRVRGKSDGTCSSCCCIKYEDRRNTTYYGKWVECSTESADRIITFHRQIHLSQLLIRRIFHRHKTFNAKIKQTFSPYRKENSTLHRLQNQRAKTFKKIISFYSNDYTRPINTPFGKIQEQQR